MARSLTGKTRYRVGWRKRLVLQVQEVRTFPTPYGDVERYLYWVDATIEDLQELMKEKPDV